MTCLNSRLASGKWLTETCYEESYEEEAFEHLALGSQAIRMALVAVFEVHDGLFQDYVEGGCKDERAEGVKQHLECD